MQQWAKWAGTPVSRWTLGLSCTFQSTEIDELYQTFLSYSPVYFITLIFIVLYLMYIMIYIIMYYYAPHCIYYVYSIDLFSSLVNLGGFKCALEVKSESSWVNKEQKNSTHIRHVTSLSNFDVMTQLVLCMSTFSLKSNKLNFCVQLLFRGKIYYKCSWSMYFKDFYLLLN